MFKVRYISRLTADLTVVWRRQMDQIRHDTVAALGHNRCHCWLSPFSLFSSLFPQPPGTTTATITIIIIITLTSGSLLGRSEVLRSLRHYLRAQSRGHHSTDRLEERGVERGSARRSSLKGRERRPQSIRRTLELFQRLRLGNFRETGWSAYGLFRAHRYHLELK